MLNPFEGFARDRDRSMAGDLYHALREEILTCRLQPGQAIREPEIAARFGVSRTPVGRALRLLREEGLVRTMAGVGHEVAVISMREYSETGQVLKALEAAAIQLACASATDADLRRLQESAAQDAELLCLQSKRDEQSAVRWYEQNTAFHSRLAECSGNRVLAQTARRLLESLRRYYYLGVGTELGNQGHLPRPHHSEMAQALLQRDSVKAIALSAEDFEWMEESRLETLKGLISPEAE